MRLALSATLIAAACLAGSTGDVTADVSSLAQPKAVVAPVGVLAVPSTLGEQPHTAGTTTTSAATTTFPAATTASATSTSTTALSATAPPVQIASSTSSSRPPGGCFPSSATLRTSSGRHVVLRAMGVVGPAPTIIVMHGYTGSPEGIEKFSELTAFANSQGVAVMYPEGTPTPSGGFGWSTGAGLFATTGTDDVEALQEMIDSAVATGCVDTTRLIISGESNGA